MRSFDNVRFIVGREEDVDNLPIQKDAELEYMCPKCGSKIKLKSGELEYCVQADGRDPDNEFLVCPKCDNCLSLAVGVGARMKLYGLVINGKIISDGTFVYFNYADKKVRIG